MANIANTQTRRSATCRISTPEWRTHLQSKKGARQQADAKRRPESDSEVQSTPIQTSWGFPVANRGQDEGWREAWYGEICEKGKVERTHRLKLREELLPVVDRGGHVAAATGWSSRVLLVIGAPTLRSQGPPARRCSQSIARGGFSSIRRRRRYSSTDSANGLRCYVYAICDTEYVLNCLLPAS